MKSVTLFVSRAVAVAVTVVATAISATGQHPGLDGTYSLDDIPVEVLSTNDAVVRMESQYFRVSNVGKAILSVREIVTVLNKDGTSAGTRVLEYDGLRRLKSAEARVIDRTGNTVRKLSKDDSADISAIDGQTLYDSHRARILHLEHDTFPYTVVIDWEMHFDGLINWPTWYPQSTDYYVQYSRYEIDVPDGLEFRVYADGLEDDRTELQKGRRTSYVWKRQNIEPVEVEPWGPPAARQIPKLLVAPVEFEIEGSTGRMDSWLGLGDWYHMLGVGRDRLPASEYHKVRGLVEGMELRDQVKTLYHYMQDRTRYVSVQLGLGGWQPFDALYVDKNGYGDCKALTNYMFSLLKAAEIEAYPALIQSGSDNHVYEDFPCNQFNHVVLYVPAGDDPIWLECTSQTIPFGELTRSTEDRPALVVKPGGSELIRTPASTSADNRAVTAGEIIIHRDGTAQAVITARFSGNLKHNMQANLAMSSMRDRVEYLRSMFELPAFDLEEVDFTGLQKRTPEARVPVKLSVPRYASVSGKRIFLRPNLFSRWNDVPPEAVERTQPVYFQFPFSMADTLQFTIPAGYDVEAQFKTVSLDESFGSFRASTEILEDGTILYRRFFSFSATLIPAAEYDTVRAFFNEVQRSDKSQLVLVKKG